ncbi:MULTISPECIES: gamma-glutamyl-gamma-aminobutyrate hydrolase family protein [Glutamicibacter]|uniref:gamma-glutamyl-gamma-aminobutyrate hydrolase family protein n=1 Tax=Glutamicibacter TaxID=1742989 RepID=UPI001FF01238|nr:MULTISPECIES: gamma-glutamyl-gamma-aminobutyrate hydrolase family protein [Glutamicibacter]WIV43718.1 gamma-glutamyl-gamma-aminobutyrate hydrolase family protein [Glutamicibacter nicotianae]
MNYPSDPATQRRPRIGLTTYWQEAKWGVWERTAAIVPGKYIKSVVAAGGTPMLLPPVATDASVLDVLDGLIVIGGVDVDPANYGHQPHPRTAAQPERDLHDMALAAAALERAVPLFAICRGAQVLNVQQGGTLNQHLPDLLPDAAEKYQPAPGVFGTVDFTTAHGSLAEQILGNQASAPCYHHQSLQEVAKGLEVTARASDGTVEIVEMPQARGWVLGTQFHPEENLEDIRLMQAFVQAAHDYATSKSISTPQEAL